MYPSIHCLSLYRECDEETRQEITKEKERS